MTNTQRIVLIDDDQVYNAIMLRAAEQAGVQLDVFTSLSDLGSFALLGQYAAAIVDYRLEHMTGVEIAEYFATFFAGTRLILVSQQDRLPAEVRSLPLSVARFIPKAAGYSHVIEQAANLAQQSLPGVALPRY